MLTAHLEFDEAAYDRSAETFERQTIAPSLVDAVNRAAARVARGIGGFLGDNLHRASDFTRQAGGYLEAEPDDPAPAALAFVRKRQASYLGYEIYGGDRRAGDPETLPGGVLVPTRDSATTTDGNLDLDAVSSEMAAADTPWPAGRPSSRARQRLATGVLVSLMPETRSCCFRPKLAIQRRGGPAPKQPFGMTAQSGSVERGMWRLGADREAGRGSIVTVSTSCAIASPSGGAAPIPRRASREAELDRRAVG